MHITSVSYRRLKTFGDYSNETVGATADVQDGDTPEQVFAYLQVWVESHLHGFEASNNLRVDIAALERKHDFLVRQVAKAEQRYEAAREFLAQHGLAHADFLAEPETDEMPF